MVTVMVEIIIKIVKMTQMMTMIAVKQSTDFDEDMRGDRVCYYDSQLSMTLGKFGDKVSALK